MLLFFAAFCFNYLVSVAFRCIFPRRLLHSRTRRCISTPPRADFHARYLHRWNSINSVNSINSINSINSVGAQKAGVGNI